MANAKKLPSGNWRIRIYSHTDENGKKHYESFTASTKQQAEIMGAKFAADIERRRADDLTIIEAVQEYIRANDGVLSPSTINGYVKDSKKISSLHSVASLRLRKLTTKDAQGIIKALSDTGLSPKTVRNTWGLIRSALTFCGCDRVFKVHLPSIAKKPPQSPEYEQIELLYRNASPTLKKCILLGCLSLRRGEISALRYGDLQGNTLYIHADMVWGSDKKWHYKDVPKTDASNRLVYLPPALVDMLGTGAADSFIIPVKPNAISNAFLRLKKKLGIDITFHSTRHFFAVLCQILQIPDSTAAFLGGWRNGSPILKSTYQGNMQSLNKEYSERIHKILDDMTQDMSQE